MKLHERAMLMSPAMVKTYSQAAEEKYSSMEFTLNSLAIEDMKAIVMGASMFKAALDTLGLVEGEHYRTKPSASPYYYLDFTVGRQTIAIASRVAGVNATMLVPVCTDSEPPTYYVEATCEWSNKEFAPGVVGYVWFDGVARGDLVERQQVVQSADGSCLLAPSYSLDHKYKQPMSNWWRRAQDWQRHGGKLQEAA